ncbi:anti-sigma factor family protein [Loktanella sp. Alg231-35]|uniref:anti-sigma factor family protein n=1 Tax=Loktanella sp. Alg231-35 TaxID=1922220 RepID=UPI000D55DDBE|nr:anti-sigma factor [Loktanella sp. Alg231-35]
MTDFSIKLSAYLDGELDGAAAQEVEARLATDPQAQAMLDAMMEADAAALEQFGEQLADPVPFALAQQIKAAPLQTNAPAATPARPIWGTLAAAAVVFALGGLGGYAFKGQTPPVVTAGWLADIADYHAVYASQGRHLVEVGADEADHIETWLGNTIGTSFTIPDLSGFDLTFEGGRLLVANGKPVAQLMYRDADGAVVALCLQHGNGATTGAPTFGERTINGFDFVYWSAGTAQYVVIGEGGNSALPDIAAAAAVEI